MKTIEREEGQGLVEYALILMLVALTVLIIIGIFGSAVTLLYVKVVAGFHAQSVEGTGNEVIVLADASVEGTGPCTVTIPAGTQIVVLQNGQPVRSSNVPMSIHLGGTSAPMDVDTNSMGIARLSAPHAASLSSCGGKVTYSW